MPRQTSDLSDFSGLTRLFPLPSLVMFPHAMQALHVFEHRYREMMADAVADDMRISLVMLRPGWTDEEYEGNPAIESVACLGHVEVHQPLADGRWNLLLRGVSRARIIEEIDTDRSYRVARVELLPDVPGADAGALSDWRARLSVAVPEEMIGQEGRAQLDRLFRSDLDLGALCDILGYALPLSLETKQSLLNEPVVAARAEILLARLGEAARPNFPPDFSIN